MSHSNTPFDWDQLSYRALSEELAEDQRWSTWDSVERLCRGPRPWPDWLVTSSAAIDTELGVLKTGKEADVFLVERAVPGEPEHACLLAAKRYRTADHRLFRRDGAYTEGRTVRNSRDGRAMAGKTDFGRAVEAGLWAQAEWSGLKRLSRPASPCPIRCRSTAGRSSWSSSPTPTPASWWLGRAATRCGCRRGAALGRPVRPVACRRCAR